MLTVPVAAGLHLLVLALLLVGPSMRHNPEQPVAVEVVIGDGAQPAPQLAAPPTPQAQAQTDPAATAAAAAATSVTAPITQEPTTASGRATITPAKYPSGQPDQPALSASQPRTSLDGVDPQTMAEILDPTHVIRAATAAQDNLPPVYPVDSVRLNEAGSVTLRLHVDATGEVVQAEVASSSGSSRLDQAALAQISGWRFQPARRNGAPVPDTIEMAIAFRLK